MADPEKAQRNTEEKLQTNKSFVLSVFFLCALRGKKFVSYIEQVRKNAVPGFIGLLVT
jgi:hypothetical protein